MAAPLRLLTGPMRVTGPLRFAHLATLVSADAVARWARAGGRPVEWRMATMAGDLGGQRDTERELAREGLDRATVGRQAFVERVIGLEAEGRARARALLQDLGVTVDLDMDALDDPAVVRAARTAFVRLYEGGRLSWADQVVAHCPRCRTIVEPVDSEPVPAPATRWVLRLPLLDDPGAEPLEVGVVALELLGGAVAVEVPPGHPATGATVALPLVDVEVPVVAGEVDRPLIVVPAHDPESWSLARPLGLAPVTVLDAEGVVRAAGPLDGLARFAARQQASVLLRADLGASAHPEAVVEVDVRCRRCGTVVVPLLGRHWFLSMSDLEVAAADVVRDGRISFHPPAAGEDLTGRAGSGASWCLSRQVWAGQQVPVATCGDCGHIEVAVDSPDSCGRCMGPLVPADDVLDARFLAAVWPLAVAGWPAGNEREVAESAGATTVLASLPSLAHWLLPSAAVGLAVAGVVPFAHLALLDLGPPADGPDDALEAHLAEVIAAEGRCVARATLLLAAGGEPCGPEAGPGLAGPLAAARALIAGLAAPLAGDADLAQLAALTDTAYQQGAPGTSAWLLAGALLAGIPPDPASRQCVRWLAGPIVGE